MRTRQTGWHSVDKKCLICGEYFSPKSSMSKFCYSCIPDNNARTRYMNYGISETQYRKMLAERSGRCVLCDEPGVSVDHDHKTGRIRGILCQRCNVGMVGIDRGLEWIKSAILYAKL